ncbi:MULTISPECIES: hypothetical protein [unclassified Pseudovibrio]|nr:MULTISPECIES: hypothetical protein [unclassified Pseudovibrio]
MTNSLVYGFSLVDTCENGGQTPRVRRPAHKETGRHKASHNA